MRSIARRHDRGRGRRTRGLAEQALRVIPEALILADLEAGQVLLENDEARRLLGPSSRDAIVAAARRAAGDAEVAVEEDGLPPLRLTLRALGSRAAVLITIGDERSRRAREEWLSIASHDLRTPLTALQLQIQTALRTVRQRPGGAAHELAPGLERIAHGATRMIGFIDALLDVARARSGTLDLRRVEVDLGALVRDSAGRFREQLEHAGSPLTLAVADGVVGRWDPLRLEQVVSNLMSNAVKYGRGAPIDVTVEREGAAARVIVRDRGIGIAPEDAARIFERFERTTGVGRNGSFGLGLWITRQIVVAHGGEIRVDSRAGQGAAFVVTLPIETCA